MAGGGLCVVVDGCTYREGGACMAVKGVHGWGVHYWGMGGWERAWLASMYVPSVVWLTSRQYASYWNADFLISMK